MTQANPYTLRCTRCHTKNRVPAQKLNEPAKCGKCGSPLDTRVFSRMAPIMVTDGDFDKAVLQAPIPVLVYFWAPWCSSCQAITPIIHDFSTRAQGRVRVAKVDIDQSPQTASRYNVMSVPYIAVIDGGQTREDFPGTLPTHQLLVRLAKYI